MDESNNQEKIEKDNSYFITLNSHKLEELLTDNPYYTPDRTDVIKTTRDVIESSKFQIKEINESIASLDKEIGDLKNGKSIMIGKIAEILGLGKIEQYERKKQELEKNIKVFDGFIDVAVLIRIKGNVLAKEPISNFQIGLVDFFNGKNYKSINPIKFRLERDVDLLNNTQMSEFTKRLLIKEVDSIRFRLGVPRTNYQKEA